MMKAKLLAKRAALAVGSVSSLITAGVARAQALDSDELFGGTTGDEFASAAGLGQADLPTTIANIIRVVLGFLGIIAVIITLFGGFKWMTAAGNDDKVSDAKKIMVSGLIGLVIILASFAIATFVITQFQSALVE